MSKRSACETGLRPVFCVFALTACLSLGGAPGFAIAKAPGPSHQKVKSVTLNCKQRPLAGAPPEAVTPAALLEAAIQKAKFTVTPEAALGWMESTLKMYGPLPPSPSWTVRERSSLQRLGMLVIDDYVIAAQMAYGLYAQQADLRGATMTLAGNMVTNLTEPSHSVPEIEATNATLAQVRPQVRSLSGALQPWVLWLARAYAYDDDVAIDVAAAGVCSLAPTMRELVTIQGLLSVARFDPSAKPATGSHKHTH